MTNQPFKKLLWSLLALPLMVSCGSEPSEPGVSEETYTISLQLFTGNALTRSTWGDDNADPDPEATPFDKTLASVDLFILDDDNRLTPLYALQQPGSAHIYTAQVTASTPGVDVDTLAHTATFSGRLMAVANMDAVGNPWFDPEAEWVSGKLPFDVRFGEDDNWHIPMWGVQRYSNITIKSNQLEMLGDIHMIRAAAKITLKLDDTLADRYSIKRVEMAEGSELFMKSGYNLPEGAMEVESTRSLQYGSQCMALRGDSAPLEALPAVGANGVWTAYVAESSLSDKNKPYTLKVTLQEKDGPEFSGLLAFGYYNTATHWQGPITDIVRNHIYQFTLRLAEMQFIPEVEVWKFGGKVHIDLE